MIVLLASDGDPSSMNIRARLLEEEDWEPTRPCWGRPAFTRDGLVLLERPGVHLDFDDVDREVKDHLACEGLVSDGPSGSGPGRGLDLIVFLSKHRSEREVESLTVHPPGNYLEARFGGRDGVLPPSAPHHMTAALRALYREKKAALIPDRTSYEVTHHGPYIGTPSFFIEIGSSPVRWERPDLARPIARALLSEGFTGADTTLPVAIGVGGGHYAPRFTDMAIKGDVAFGHMVPDHILLRHPAPNEAIELAMRATPGASLACIHRTKDNRDLLDDWTGHCASLGLKVVIG